MTDPIDLDAIDALYLAATAEQWDCDDPGTQGGRSIGGREFAPDRSCSCRCTICDDMHENNAELVVALHTAWPSLRDELTEARAECERLREQVRKRAEFRRLVDGGEPVDEAKILPPSRMACRWSGSSRGGNSGK